MRKRLYEIIEPTKAGDKASNIYDCIMMITIIASLVPLAFKQETKLFAIMDKVTVSIFIADYFLRLSTADLKLKGKGVKAFFLYPFTPMAIVDLVSILPSLIALNGGLKALRVLRLLRTLKVLQVFKVVRYSKSIELMINVFKKQKKPLLFVLVFATGYVLVAGLVGFNAEPETFDNYFEAVYWATVSLTTVGYGDIYPVTVLGRVITMISSILGIAIVALPSGIITGGYLQELNRMRREEFLKKGKEMNPDLELNASMTNRKFFTNNWMDEE